MEPTNHPFRKETWSAKPPFLGSMLIFQGVWISSSRYLTTYRRYGNIDNPDQRIAQDIGSADGRTNSGCQRMENELAVLEVWEDDMKKITTYEFWLSEESNEVMKSLGFLLLKIWISQIGWIGWAVLKVTFLPLAASQPYHFGAWFHWFSPTRYDKMSWGAGFLRQGKYMTTFDRPSECHQLMTWIHAHRTQSYRTWHVCTGHGTHMGVFWLCSMKKHVLASAIRNLLVMELSLSLSLLSPWLTRIQCGCPSGTWLGNFCRMSLRLMSAIIQDVWRSQPEFWGHFFDSRVFLEFVRQKFKSWNQGAPLGRRMGPIAVKHDLQQKLHSHSL